MISVFKRVENILGKNQKRLISSVFLFSHKVFKSYLFQGHQKLGLYNKVCKIMEFMFERMENIVGEAGNANSLHLSFFQNNILKSSFPTWENQRS